MPGLPPSLVRADYQAFRRIGLTPEQAGNVVAWLRRLPRTEQPWTVDQIEAVLARRWEAGMGRWQGEDDRRSASAVPPTPTVRRVPPTAMYDSYPWRMYRPRG